MRVTRYLPRESAESEVINQRNGWQQHAIILLPILLVYLVLAFYGIDRQSLWIDEVFSIRDASSQASLWLNGHGPLYYVMLRLWMHIGTSEMVLRALSALLGAVAVCLLYAISMQLFSRRVSAIGTLLFATSPYLIWYSQEVRYITLMLATALFTTYIFLHLTTRSRLGWWLAYGSTLTLAWASFPTNILLPVIHGLYLLWSSLRRPILRKWIVCQILVFAIFIGWASGKYLLAVSVKTTAYDEQALSIDLKSLKSGTPKEFSPMMLPYTFFAFSTGFSQGPSVRKLHLSRSLATLITHAPVLLTLSVLFGSLFLMGLRALWRQPDTGKLLLLWVGLPILGALSVSILTNMAYNVRYVSMALPAFVLILAAGIAQFRWSVIQAIILVAVLGSNALSLSNYYFSPEYAREDARAVVQYLKSAIHSQDIILIVGSPWAIEYYAKGSLPIAKFGNLSKGTDQYIAKRLRNLTNGYERLWLVETRAWSKDPKGRVKALMDNSYNFVDHKQWSGVTIYVYQLS